MFALPCIIPSPLPPPPLVFTPSHITAESFERPDLGCEWDVILMTLLARIVLAVSGSYLSSVFGTMGEALTKTVTLPASGAQEGRAFNDSWSRHHPKWSSS